MRRTLLISLLVLVSLVGGFLGYGWWTRRGPIEFTRGGAFGSADASPSATAATGDRDRPGDGRGTSTPETSQPARPSPAASVKDTRRAREPAGAGSAGSLAPPVPGTYYYEGRGREDVDFGPASACGWDIEEVTAVAKRDQGMTVLDWTWSANRQQRGIYDIGAEGMLHRYFGGAATCLGMRRTEEGAYQPPAVRLPPELKPGVRWTSTARSPSWSERTDGEIVRRERVGVPAGTFDAYVVRMRTTFSDGQSGTFEATLWYAPAVGMWIKERAKTNVRTSGATFISSYEIALRSFPR